MKRNLKIFSLFVFVLLGLVLTGCKPTRQESDTLGKTTDVYGFGVVTSANILSDSSSQKLSTRLTQNNDEIDMDKVNEYVHMLESMIVDGGPILINEETSDKDGYESKLTYKASSLSGEEVEYILYLNKKEIVDKDDDDFEDMFDNEKEYVITGIAIIEGVEYSVKGEDETEDDESELKLTIALDSQNYVFIEEEKESNEVEYSYVVYKEGRVYTRLSVERENYKELEISFYTTNSNGQKEKYYFEKDVEFGVHIIKIRHEVNGRILNIIAKGKLDESTNQIVYEYRVEELDRTYKYK